MFYAYQSLIQRIQIPLKQCSKMQRSKRIAYAYAMSGMNVYSYVSFELSLYKH